MGCQSKRWFQRDRAVVTAGARLQSAERRGRDLDSDSMLSLYRALITLRRNEPALSVGAWRGLPASGDVLAYERCGWIRNDS